MTLVERLHIIKGSEAMSENQSNELDTYASVRRIAKLLDVTKPAVHDLIRRQELDAIRVGRKYCVSLASFRAFCARNKAA